MCQMLLSINPEHIESIICGKKRFEFRKVRCKADVDKIIIYSTAPVMRVVAEAVIKEVIEDDVDKVWSLTKEYAGISYNFYQKYYKGRKKAVAYRLCEVIKYPEPKTLSDVGVAFAPQSFVYLGATT